MTAPAIATDRYAALLDPWVKDEVLRGNEEATAKRYAGCVQRFLAHAHEERGTAPFDVDDDDLRGFLQHLKDDLDRAPNTILNHFSALRSFYKFHVLDGAIDRHPVTEHFRERYLRQFQEARQRQRQRPQRRAPTNDELRRMVQAAAGARDRALLLVLAKTGLRRNELVQLDQDRINLASLELRTHEHKKRSNTRVFFDEEARIALQRWLDLRDGRAHPDEAAVFVSNQGTRLQRQGVYRAVVDAATRAGVHDADADRGDRITPHSLRHFFTSTLLNADVNRSYVKWLRGDARREAADLYHHIEPEQVQQAYRAAMPSLGLYGV